MSEENTENILRQIIQNSNPSARIAYWNMLVPRSRPERLSGSISSLTELSSELHHADKAFFYSKFIVEEVTNK
jgi:S-adenosylmethionine-diacylglycerol 3-amino-3-carboxypropyl transferase